jgi:Protein of unknown function (DUF2892)
MKKNMGMLDKKIRLAVAVLLAGLYFTNTITGTLALVAVIVAAVFALTSVISFCPLYTLFGSNTCKVK